LSDPRMIGTNMEPWVDGSCAITSCQMRLEAQQKHRVDKTYGLPPRPITRHHVAILPFLSIKFLIWCVINVLLEIRTSQDVHDHLARVPVPNVVHRGLPFWRTSRHWERALVFQAGILPPNITKVNCVDLLMKILVTGDWWGIAVGNKCGGPQLKELVDLFL